MVESYQTVRPTLRRAIIIGNSDYHQALAADGTGYQNLPPCLNDAKNVEQLLSKILHFEVKTLINKTVRDVKKHFETFIAEEAEAIGYEEHKEHKNAIFFIYYSGHGCMLNGRTAGIDIEGNPINFDAEFIDEVGSRKNITLISFLDCCRVD